MTKPKERTTRRHLLRGAAAFGLYAALVPVQGAAAGGEAVFGQDGSSADSKSPDPTKSEKEHVMSAGLTEAEAEAWIAAADAAGKFFALPEVHPMDKQEVATAIHLLQNKLLSRPTYRAYLESHGAKGK